MHIALGKSLEYYIGQMNGRPATHAGQATACCFIGSEHIVWRPVNIHNQTTKLVLSLMKNMQKNAGFFMKNLKIILGVIPRPPWQEGQPPPARPKAMLGALRTLRLRGPKPTMSLMFTTN